MIAIIREISEKKKAEQKLVESEMKYRMILENTKDAIVIVGLDGKLKYITPSLLRMLGKDDYDLNAGFFNNIHPDDKEQLIEEFSNAVTHEEFKINSPIEYRTKHDNGRYIWISAIAKKYHDDTGKLIGFIASLRDITERKIVEQKLKESELKYRTLIEQSFIGITIVQEGKISFINNHLLNLLEQERDDMLGKEVRSLFRFIHIDDILRVAQGYKNRLEGNADASVTPEFRILTKSGKILFITAESKFIDMDGQKSLISFYRDISEERLAGQKLKDSEEKYRLITETANDFIALLNDQFEYEFINESIYLKGLGYSNQDLLGKN
ncbi:MAG: PAS domain S-box protein, partial [archaeon]|nr:PAS domain S-box protein [archaeon]